MMPILRLAPVLPLVSGLALSAAPAAPAFQRTQITSTFWSEGACVADFNRDGKPDFAAGPHWYAGPDFKQRHEFTAPPAKPYDGATGYSDYFLAYAHDFDADGWADILVFTWPGKDASWYRNPGKAATGHWQKYVLMDEANGESPSLFDMNGDGKPELLAFSSGRLGFGEIDWKNPTAKAAFRAISPADPKKYQRYTHGYGAGDINGDGRPDLLDKDGWWEQPADYRSGAEWRQHKFPFAPTGRRGGAQMLVFDVNGDGLNDVVTSWDAHGYGLAWYEQARTGQGDIGFREHVLVNTEPAHSPHGVKFTQPHALVAADINRDGLMDFVSGKRFWSHGPNKDAEPGAPAVIYWFELRRRGREAEFIPHLVDSDSGVGTQITVADLNGDGRPDILSSNKKGIHTFIQQKK